MNQTGAVAVTRTEQIFIRDQESDCDDDDRRQLIIQYANDTYLSKWDAADNSDGKDDKPNIRLTVKVPNSNAKIDQEDSCQAESGHLGTTYDCDELSLVSYNSLRDGTSLALPKTAPASLSCQLPFAGGKEELKLFQGYGGNIYFDAVRCKSMIINSTKSVRPKKQASSDNCKSNSRISSKRDVVDQVHTSCVSSSPTEAPTSTHVLGSLRMRSCKEKIWRPGESRHKDTKRHLSGKICKGFSEKLLTETFQKFYEKQGNSVAGKPMVVSGGSVGHATAVDSIGNNQIGFPALISNSSFFSHRGRQKSPEVVDSDDGNPFMKLPFLKKYEGKKKTRKSDGKKLGEERKMVNEVSSVFIIPFGAFDDPVDFESQDVKRKVDNKEKASTIGDTCENGGYSSLENRKGRFLEKSSEFDSVLVPARVENHNIKDTVACSDDNGNSAKHPSPDPRAKTLMKAAQPGSANLFVKREISNISLSNYLRAVPTRVSKEPVQVTSSQSYTKPKISYTKRSQALSTLYMVNNTHHAAKASQKMTASQLSRGCIPNTSGKESQLFYAEISTCADGNSLKSDDYRQDSHRRSQSSGNFIKTLRSSQAPKHAFVKANYVSRSSSTHQGPEQASTIFDPVRNSQKNVFPITGQQISGLSGVQDR